jgi:hypothetical protein
VSDTAKGAKTAAPKKGATAGAKAGSESIIFDCRIMVSYFEQRQRRAYPKLCLGHPFHIGAVSPRFFEHRPFRSKAIPDRTPACLIPTAFASSLVEKRIRIRQENQISARGVALVLTVLRVGVLPLRTCKRGLTGENSSYYSNAMSA